jgi:preprotein translocase subunit SecA
MASILDRLMRAGEGKILRDLSKIVDKVNALEASITPLSDEQLRAKTDEFKSRFAQGETLDDLMPEAFAVVREAAQRTLGQRHYDVQVMGGAALHSGNIAEMRTGEGKTLVSTLPSYLNALAGRGVHVVTVNDYLAERDSEWMGRIHRFLGLSVGVILNSMTPAERQILPTAQIMNLVLITFATIWRGLWRIACSAITSSLLSMKWTPFLSMKLVRLSSSADPLIRQRSGMWNLQILPPSSSAIRTMK